MSPLTSGHGPASLAEITTTLARCRFPADRAALTAGSGSVVSSVEPHRRLALLRPGLVHPVAGFRVRPGGVAELDTCVRAHVCGPGGAGGRAVAVRGRVWPCVAVPWPCAVSLHTDIARPVTTSFPVGPGSGRAALSLWRVEPPGEFSERDRGARGLWTG